MGEEGKLVLKRWKREPSEKQIYFWNTISNVANAALSFFFLIAVTRLTDPVSSDTFSLGWAVAQLMFTIGTFQVRLFQTTDASGKYSFHQYLKFRGITIFAMVLISAGYIFFNHYSGIKATVILLLCGYKAVDAASDVYQGWFQQKERLDFAGKALTARVVTAFILFTVILWLTKNIILSCISINISSWICFIFFEIRYYQKGGMKEEKEPAKGNKWILEIAIQCLPLFLNFFLINGIFNSPKMAIDSAIENGVLQAGTQTAYNIIFMPSSCINLVYLVFRHIVTKMAVSWKENDFILFTKQFRTILISLLFLSVIICIAALLFGIPVLQWAYSVDLSGLKTAFLILLAGGCCNAFVNAFDNAMTIMRKQYLLLPIYGLAAIEIFILAPILVNKNGIQGASIAFLISQVTLLVLIWILFQFFYSRGKNCSKRNGDI